MEPKEPASDSGPPEEGAHGGTSPDAARDREPREAPREGPREEPPPGDRRQDPLERSLHAARALILADLEASDVAHADIVSLVEEAVSHRRWWVGEWPEGAAFVDGLVAQDVQDALLERYGRWPVCPVCVGSDPHALDVEPELGEEPHWVCAATSTVVARVGSLGGKL
ncbi:hypothetical protein AB0939_08540 [Streptomyces sp. NPDC006990]|uniref:hypothetical protein n=1 Tax=Streptomyces sp. NPDC006990 TaxID=3154481 RepID=UPI0034525BA0